MGPPDDLFDGRNLSRGEPVIKEDDDNRNRNNP